VSAASTASAILPVLFLVAVAGAVLVPAAADELFFGWLAALAMYEPTSLKCFERVIGAR
jgi:hypothetical protein